MNRRTLENLWWIVPIFIAVIATFPKHLYEFNLYIPSGLYIQIMEFILIGLLPFITWYFYKKKVKYKETEGFWNKVLTKAPAIYLVFSFLFNFLIASWIVYTFGLFMDYLPQNYNYKTYKVKILSVDRGVKRYCSPALKTDILKRLDSNNKSLFHSFLAFSDRHKICTAKSGSKQYLGKGAEVTLAVKESKWGIYVYGIP